MTRARLMSIAALGALVACAAMWAPQADAQLQNEVKIYGGEDEKPVTNAQVVPDEFDVGVGGLVMFRIRADAAGFTAAERARIVDARMVHILSYGDLDAEAVQVVPVRGKPTVYVGDVRLVTIYPSDVEAVGAASMQQLASWWAASVACCLKSVAPWMRVKEMMM